MSQVQAPAPRPPKPPPPAAAAFRLYRGLVFFRLRSLPLGPVAGGQKPGQVLAVIEEFRKERTPKRTK